MIQKCCHIGCEETATNMITGKQGIGYDDTYMCDKHTWVYKTENDTVTPMDHAKL